MEIYNYYRDGQPVSMEFPKGGLQESYTFGTATRFMIREEIVNGEHGFVLISFGQSLACARAAQPLRDIIARSVLEQAMFAQEEVAKEMSALGGELAILNKVVRDAAGGTDGWIGAYCTGPWAA